MVLEYLEGKTLQKLYEELKAANQQLTPADALILAAQMLEGADAAHAVGIVHRDLKPDNVMIVEGSHGEPFVKLLDFGIAKLRVAGQSIEPGMTRPGVVMGTAEYMAPEQAFSADSGRRARRRLRARRDLLRDALGAKAGCRQRAPRARGRPPLGEDPAHRHAGAFDRAGASPT